jgi:hypothetical protein
MKHMILQLILLNLPKQTMVIKKMERNISLSKSQTMQIKKNHRKTSEMVEVAQIRKEVVDLDPTFRAKFWSHGPLD